jgi:hypothetical protein
LIGNETLLGQIATIMDALHLTYTEVFEKIPYRNLLIMQKDKLHEACGKVIKKTTGKELMGEKIKGYNM